MENSVTINMSGIVCYDRSSDNLFMVLDTFRDEEVEISFFILDVGLEKDALMDTEYFDNNREVIGWL
jgi:hypothetical protein